MPRRSIGCLTVGAACWALAAPAAAQQQLAPPGNSGVDQYLETVPSAGGNATPQQRKKPVLPAATRRELAARGADGKQLDALVDASAPPRRPERPARRAPAGSDEQGAERSPLGSATDALLGQSDGDGAGSALPLFLIVSTVVLAFVALRRRRQA